METFEIIYLLALGFFMGMACVNVVNITLNEIRSKRNIKLTKEIIETYVPDILKYLNKPDNSQELLNPDGSKYNHYLDTILNRVVNIEDNLTSNKTLEKEFSDLKRKYAQVTKYKSKK